jgi:FAD/FMN-containing dehydrogenase
VRAQSTDGVRAVVAACVRRGLPVVARGDGTRVSGGANATERERRAVEPGLVTAAGISRSQVQIL